MQKKDFLGIFDLPKKELEYLLNQTPIYKEILARPIKKVPVLRGKTIVTLFYEPSTRTRMSFELAGKRLSADMSNIAVSSSAVAKGENLKDTVRTIEAMGVDAIIIRHSQAGAPHLAALNTKASVINAGDGTHEHPTQTLLDLYTIMEKKEKIKGLHVGIVGDIAHSRVAKSDIYGFKKLGAKVTLIAPPTLLPAEVDKFGVDVSYNLDKVLPELDVLYILRLQLERQAKGLFPSLLEYIKLYGVHKDRLKKCKDDILVMHPGPMNIGVEISEEVATCVSSGVIEQVSNGVAVRMALLNHLLGGN
ncbi:MAG: aspartate carbamoyltransferase catalytic subunit [Armatimonadota bacterium]